MVSPLHEFFELSYANYLVVPRSLLQSCSPETQRALVVALDLVREEERLNLEGHWPGDAVIEVRLRNAAGRYVRDPLADYDRGRRKLWHVIDDTTLGHCILDAEAAMLPQPTMHGEWCISPGNFFFQAVVEGGHIAWEFRRLDWSSTGAFYRRRLLP